MKKQITPEILAKVFIAERDEDKKILSGMSAAWREATNGKTICNISLAVPPGIPNKYIGVAVYFKVMELIKNGKLNLKLFEDAE